MRWEQRHTASLGLLSSPLVHPSSLQPSAALQENVVTVGWQRAAAQLTIQLFRMLVVYKIELRAGVKVYIFAMPCFRRAAI